MNDSKSDSLSGPESDSDFGASFAPISSDRSRVLILGSLPGRMSLARAEYYAMPRNAFWRIMGDLFGLGPEMPYEARTRGLVAAGLALWDVCGSARRAGSLDSAIDPDSIVVNDFTDFLGAHPQIRLIGFNGATAWNLYRRRVLPGLPPSLPAIRSVRLPSTSPAHAGMPYPEKLARWSVIREATGD